MRTKNTILLSASLVAGIVIFGGAAYAVQTSRQQIDSLSELAQACHREKDKDGFGNVTMAGVTIRDQKGKLTVPCKVRLKPGSTLQFKNIELESKDLLIYDQPKDPKQAPPKKANHVILNNVRLSGKDAGFQLNLANPASTIVIQDSVIDYPNSVGAGVGEGDTDSKASLSAQRNVMRSKGENSEGITLVSTGQASFISNRFELYTPDDIALLLGNTCEFKNNINANDRCHGDQ